MSGYKNSIMFLLALTKRAYNPDRKAGIFFGFRGRKTLLRFQRETEVQKNLTISIIGL